LKIAVPKECPVCGYEFTISTAMDEKQFCSLSCENGKPQDIKKKKLTKR
jgi:hypothetical protein